MVNGVYRYELTDDDLRAGGVTDPEGLRRNHGESTVTLDDGRYVMEQRAPDLIGGNHPDDPDLWSEEGTYTVSGGQITITVGPRVEVFNFVQAADGDLTLTAVLVADHMATCCSPPIRGTASATCPEHGRSGHLDLPRLRELRAPIRAVSAHADGSVDSVPRTQARPSWGSGGLVSGDGSPERTLIMRKSLAVAVAAVVGGAVVFGVAAVQAASNSTDSDRFTVVEHADTDIVIESAPTGDSLGDTLAFGNPVFDEGNATEVGRDQGSCVRTEVGVAWECSWTTILDGGSLTVAGPFYDAGDSTLAIIGGTGRWSGAGGEMQLHARNPQGTEYDFTFVLD